MVVSKNATRTVPPLIMQARKMRDLVNHPISDQVLSLNTSVSPKKVPAEVSVM
jgi:hypothetical protein